MINMVENIGLPNKLQKIIFIIVAIIIALAIAGILIPNTQDSIAILQNATP